LFICSFIIKINNNDNRGKPTAWDVTVANTYAESHLSTTTLTAGAASDKAAANKEMKYSALANTHIFFPVTIKTSGVMNQLAVDLVSEIGRHISSVTENANPSYGGRH